MTLLPARLALGHIEPVESRAPGLHRAGCSCGAMSPGWLSASGRRVWIRTHFLEVSK